MKKTTTLAPILPLSPLENNCLLSRQGDITLAFQLKLPEIFTLSADDFESLHQTWVKAIKSLPNHTVIHKQDWFMESSYIADFSKPDQSFLSRSSERYFNERPYLDHQSYLFITKKPDGRRGASSLV